MVRSDQVRQVRLDQVGKLRSGRSAQFSSKQVDLDKVRVRSGWSGQVTSGRSEQFGKVDQFTLGWSGQVKPVMSG